MLFRPGEWNQEAYGAVKDEFRRRGVDELAIPFEVQSRLLLESTLTPSEVVLLAAEQLDEGRWSDERGHAITIVTAALLANNGVGTIRLEAVSGPTVQAEPGEMGFDWPALSLEAQILEYVRHENIEGRVVPIELFRGLDPFCKDGLVARGLAERTTVKKWKVFSSTHYEVPAATLSLLTDDLIVAVGQLLDVCRRDRAELWMLMQVELAEPDREFFALGEGGE